MKNFILLFLFPFLFGGDDEYFIKMVSISKEPMVFFSPLKINNSLLLTVEDKRKMKGLHSNYIEIYYSDLLDEGELSDIKKIKFNLPKKSGGIYKELFFSFGIADHHPSKSELFFTCNYQKLRRSPNLNSYGEDVVMISLSIGVGVLQDGGVDKYEILPFCDGKINYYHPTISSDGKTLIFGSDMNGISNLYYSERNLYRGTWSEPKLIEELESEFLTSSPKLINDSLLVYSMIDTLTGNGGLDIYRSEKINGVWSFPENWEELNSEFDDYGVEMIDENSGYFSSTRDSSNAKLYYFEKIKK